MFRKRNLFDLSYENKLTGEMGFCIPVMCEEVVPGDKFRVSTDSLVRLAPMLAPVMQNINVYMHYFFVPNRLIWDDWENFITGGKDGNDNSVAPTISITNAATSTLADYLGVPTGVANALSVSALPFRAYARIWNDWYRSEDLQNELTISTASGVDATTNTSLQRRGWQRDYFTSALPFRQRGSAVSLPLGDTAPVIGNGKGIRFTDGTVSTDVVHGSANGNAVLRPVVAEADPQDIGAANANAYTATANKILGLATDGSKSGVVADLSQATAATINDIRRAFQVQRWLELNATAGCRYVESILAHFGVRSSDARLQRSEYLGGGRAPVMISEVLQHSADDNQPTPLGTMAGHGVSALKTFQFKKFFEEHGFVIGILSVMPRSSYYQGLSKMWTRNSRYDYYWPVFSHLGEDAVYNREIYAQGTNDDAGVFGYQPRYQEYRKRYGSIHGDFRTAGMDFWHLARKFNSLPALNAQFIACVPDNRIFAVPGTQENPVDHLWIQLYNSVKALRPIPKYGTPGLIDHI